MNLEYIFLPYVLSFVVFLITYREFFTRGIHDVFGITLFFGNVILILGMLVSVLFGVSEYVLYTEVGTALVFFVFQFIGTKKPQEPVKELKKPSERKSITLEDILGE